MGFNPKSRWMNILEAWSTRRLLRPLRDMDCVMPGLWASEAYEMESWDTPSTLIVGCRFTNEIKVFNEM
jgi:hypothetical protein